MGKGVEEEKKKEGESQEKETERSSIIPAEIGRKILPLGGIGLGMLKFRSNQKITKIGPVEMGGQGGELSTVLIGSIFYTGHQIVSDLDKGVFDEREAKRLLDIDEEMSKKYAIPRMIDVVAETSEAMIRYLDFISANTDSPLLLDATNPQVRMDGIEYAAKIGIIDRVVYNSLGPHYKEEELKVIEGVGLKNAVVLAFGEDYLFPQDRIKLLMGHEGKRGLVDAARDAGIENILVDVGVLDIPSISWSSQAIFEVKDNLGLPAGCAASNGLYSWKRDRKIPSPEFEVSGATLLTFSVLKGADFILYGPIKNAPWVYPAFAMVDAIIAYGGKLQGIRPKTKNHPLYKIF